MALEVMMRAAAPIPLEASFRVEAGEILALVGPSGSGKTTILRTIAGLWRPEAARVAVNGETWLDTASGVSVAPHRRHVGVVFQNYALFPHMSALENVMAAMHQRAPDPKAEAGRLLALVSLPGLADRRPAQLSGGQQQRVAVARALARRPQALLLDEPFSAVDRATREGLYDVILTLRGHLSMPVILVTHDVNEAQLLGDRIAVIEGGRLVREGPAGEVMADPQALRAMGVREAAAMLPAIVVERDEDGLTRLDCAAGALFLPAIDAAPGARVRVRIMAHDVVLARHRPEGLSAQNILKGEIAAIVPGTGPGVIVHVRIGDGEILARITRRAANQLRFQPGEVVHAIVKSLSVARDHVARTPQ